MSLRRMTIAVRFLIFVAVPFSLITQANGDEPKSPELKVIPAAEAKNHLDETLTVELTVKSQKNATSVETYFLDSEEDYKDEKNLAIAIAYEFAPKFKEAGIDDPTEYYKGKAIRVTGKIVKEGKQTRIRVTEPKQITLVEKKKD